MQRRLHLESLEERRLLSASGSMETHIDPFSTSALHGSADRAAVTSHVLGEILVGFDGDVASTFRNHGAEQALKKAGDIVGAQGLSDGQVLFDVPAGNGHGERIVTRWNLGAGVDVLNKVNSLTGVAYAEPNGFMWASRIIPDDPGILTPVDWPFGYQEHLEQIGAYDPSGIDAWDTTQGDPVVIAVVDSGVDLDHPDLNDNLLKNGETIVAATCESGCSTSGIVGGGSHGGHEVSGNAKGGNPGKPGGGGGGGGGGTPAGQDDYGHGTHVAGIIASEIANIDNAYEANGDTGWAGGVVGVAPLSKIMPVKVLGSNGSGAFADVALGIDFAVTNGANIINMSLGGGFSQAVSDSIFAAYQADVLVISSAGNSNADGSGHPASDPYSLSIAAVDSADVRASFSNYGFTVDIAAPGVNVLSTFIDITDGSNESGNFTGAYGRISGTSMAAPVVSGVAALIMAAHPGITAAAVASQLLATADNIDFDNPGFEGKLGAGRINALAAVGSQIMDPEVIAVSGLGPAGSTITDLDVGEVIGVQFSHVMTQSSVEDVSANYKLLYLGADGLVGGADANTDIPIPLQLSSGYLDAFPGRGVKLQVNGVAPDGRYHFSVDSALLGNTDFVHSFTIGAQTLSTESVTPLGGLIYEQTVFGSVSGNGETDSFAVDVDAGQTITVRVIPGTTLQPTVELFDSSDTPVGSSIDAVLQTVAVSTQSTYTVTVGGELGTTGGYTLQILLNAAVDVESNNTIGTAQEINESFITLAANADFDSKLGTDVERGAVLGSLRSTSTGSTVVEGFEVGNLDAYQAKGKSNTSITNVTDNVHEGSFSLQDETNNGPKGWIFRDDSDVVVQRGDVYSVWVKMEEEGVAGRAYAGFGASDSGTLSIVMGANTGELLLQRHASYDYEDLGVVSQTWLRDHWYRMEVTWETDGDLIGRLYDNDGVTLLNTVTGHDDTITSGGLAFRAFDSTKHFDTIEVGALAPDPADVYAFTLAAGEAATLVATSLNGGNVDLELLDSGGLLSTGNTGPVNIDEVIEFSGGLAGTYYAKVTGDADVEYSLVVTRNSFFDLEENGDSSTAQDITVAPVALGYIGAIDVLWVGPNSTEWGDGPYNITQIDVSQFATQNLAGFDVIYVDTSATQGNEAGPSILLDRTSDIETFVNSGGGLITDNGGNASSADFSWVPVPSDPSGLSWIVENDDTVLLTLEGLTHPITAGLTNADLSGWNNSQHNYFDLTAGMDVLATNGADQANVLADSFGSGRLVYFGLNPSHSTHQAENEPAHQLIRQAATWAAGDGAGDEDFYKIELNSGDSRTISTLTPGSEVGGLVNSLNPGLEVIDPNGVIVTSTGDGNETIIVDANVTGPGVYTIRVFAENNTAGEYVLVDPPVGVASGTESTGQASYDFNLTEDANRLLGGQNFEPLGGQGSTLSTTVEARDWLMASLGTSPLRRIEQPDSRFSSKVDESIDEILFDQQFASSLKAQTTDRLMASLETSLLQRNEKFQTGGAGNLLVATSVTPLLKSNFLLNG